VERLAVWLLSISKKEKREVRMENNDCRGSTSRWASNFYKRLANVQYSSDDTIMEGRIKREKIGASLDAIEQEGNELTEHNNAQLARRNRELHEKAIEIELNWLNANGFPATLEKGLLVVKGLESEE
jgi:hypothetical protein